MSAAQSNSARGASRSLASSAAAASSNEVPMPETADRVHGMLITLFQHQQERAQLIKRSRELNEKMQSIKARAERWMRENNSDCFKVSSCGRKLKRVKRNKYGKMTEKDILDWVAEKGGDELKCDLEKEMKRRKSTVVKSEFEYRITYLGVRKRNEQVAPDDGRSRSSAPTNSASASRR